MEAVIDEVLDAPDSDDQEEHEDRIRMTNNLRFDNVLKLQRTIVKKDDSMERGDIHVHTKINSSDRNLNTIQSKNKDLYENKQHGGNEEIKSNRKSTETKHRSFTGSKYPNILSKNKQQQNKGSETTLILPKVRRSAARARKKTPKDRPKSRKRFGNEDKKLGITIVLYKTEQTTINFTDCSGRHKKYVYKLSDSKIITGRIRKKTHLSKGSAIGSLRTRRCSVVLDKSSVLENITDTEHIKVSFKKAEIPSKKTQGSKADEQVFNTAMYMQ